jgi:hypothetical protein
MDVNKLMKALDNETNENLLNFTTQKITEMNLNILKELKLSKKDTLELLSKLKNYKYVDEMNELKYGAYLRWIPMTNPDEIYLTKGALFCEFKITDNGVFMICKNFGFGSRHFRISLDNNLFFQKLTDQELVLLSALDHLSK